MAAPADPAEVPHAQPEPESDGGRFAAKVHLAALLVGVVAGTCVYALRGQLSGGLRVAVLLVGVLAVVLWLWSVYLALASIADSDHHPWAVKVLGFAALECIFPILFVKRVGLQGLLELFG